MELEVTRYSSQEHDTLGLLHDVTGDSREFLCFTLEDEHRTEKVWGETRIPAGRYPIELRTEGGHHARYAKRFASIHKGMLHIMAVPGFELILIHIGNDDDDTAGCLLTGDEARQNVTGQGALMKSTAAYRRIYLHVLDAFDTDEDVWITYTDFDTP